MKPTELVRVVLFEGKDDFDAIDEVPYASEDWATIAEELVANGSAEVKVDTGRIIAFEQGLDRSPFYLDESAEEAEMFVTVYQPGAKLPDFAVLALHKPDHELDEAALNEAYILARATFGDDDLDLDAMERTVATVTKLKPLVALVPIGANQRGVSQAEYEELYNIASQIGRALVFQGRVFNVRKEKVNEALSRVTD